MRAPRYRLDELRRFASALAEAAGLAPARAAALASHLLWYDALALSAHGLATLPGWLDRIEAGSLTPGADGSIGPEHAGTAVLDARGGLAPLVLGRAAALAAEKARDVGVGLVRIVELGHAGPAAAAAAEAATGPYAAVALGPAPSWTLGLPSFGGPPAVFDSALADPKRGRPGWVEAIGPWAAALAPQGEWLMLVVAVSAIEAASGFQERVAALSQPGPPDAALVQGQLLPAAAEDRRRQAREQGVALPAEALNALRGRAERLGVEPPAPRSG